MKINKKDILKKYVLPILIFGGIIFLATMKGSTIEKFDMERCVNQIKKSAKGKLKGCKEWDGDENAYGECNKKGKPLQDAVIKWAESYCEGEKNDKDAEKAYGKQFIKWSKSQVKKYQNKQKTNYKLLGPAAIIASGPKTNLWKKAPENIAKKIALEVKF